jgi:DNA polymerase-1
MGLVREVLDSLGISRSSSPVGRPTTHRRGHRRPVERGDDVVIVTGDRDSYQLVDDPHVKVLYNRRGVSDYAMYDEAGISSRPA